MDLRLTELTNLVIIMTEIKEHHQLIELEVLIIEAESDNLLVHLKEQCLLIQVKIRAKASIIAKIDRQEDPDRGRGH